MGYVSYQVEFLNGIITVISPNSEWKQDKSVKSYLDTSWLYRCTGGDIPCKASTHKYLYILRFLLKKKKKINRTLLIISKLNDSSVSIKT